MNWGVGISVRLKHTSKFSTEEINEEFLEATQQQVERPNLFRELSKQQLKRIKWAAQKAKRIADNPKLYAETQKRADLNWRAKQWLKQVCIGCRGTPLAITKWGKVSTRCRKCLDKHVKTKNKERKARNSKRQSVKKLSHP